MNRTGDELPTPPEDASQSGPVGVQVREILGLDSSSELDELTPKTQSAVGARGLELKKRLGKGGYGSVYSARDRRTGKGYAVKVVLNPGNDTAMSCFRRERDILSKGELPQVIDGTARIAPVFHFDDESPGAQPFLVMELIDGLTLRAFVERFPSLAIGQRLALCERILGTFAALHRANLIHRDVSLGNIMIERGTSWVRLVDFGSAGRREVGYHSARSLSQVPVTPATASGRLAAGEVRGSAADDAHAVAHCCFYLLTGKLDAKKQSEPDWRESLRAARVPADLIETFVNRMREPSVFTNA